MILMNDFGLEPPELHQKMKLAAARVIDSGWYVLGGEVAAFENQWSSLCNIPFAIGVGNGMDAIEIALRSLGVGAGDEVITTPITAFPTVLAIYRAGAVPVLADIEPESGLLSMESVGRCISQKTKAIILVHLYGQLRSMDEWVSFCKKKNLFLIEDCAQAHLASFGGRIAGSFGEFGAYSFYPTKNLGAIGDAGALVTRSLDLANEAKMLRNYGQSVRYHHPLLGLNSRLDEIQAAMLLVKMRWLEEFTIRRRKIAKKYFDNISNPLVKLLKAPEGELEHVHHLFVVLCERREDLIRYLNSHNIESLIHYPIPIHKQESCANIIVDSDGLTNAEKHASMCLSIPCHPQMTDQDVVNVISVINSFK